MVKEPRSTVLVADDDPWALKVLHQTLELSHFRVLAARDGQETLEILAQHPCDLLILDLGMPRLSGLRALEEIRRRYPQMPVIVVTGLADSSDVPDLHRRGAREVLSKPCTPAELLAAVERVLSPPPHP
jgi:CheY-like chemotaxis protein